MDEDLEFMNYWGIKMIRTGQSDRTVYFQEEWSIKYWRTSVRIRRRTIKCNTGDNSMTLNGFSLPFNVFISKSSSSSSTPLAYFSLNEKKKCKCKGEDLG